MAQFPLHTAYFRCGTLRTSQFRDRRVEREGVNGGCVVPRSHGFSFSEERATLRVNLPLVEQVALRAFGTAPDNLILLGAESKHRT